jgi:hypothetical protein
MVSTVKVTNIDTPDNTGNITFDRPIAGDGSNLTGVAPTKATVEALGIDVPAANLTGTVATARLGSGATSTTFLRGDQTYAAAGLTSQTGAGDYALPASGSLSITGVGFQPTCVFFNAVVNGNDTASIGFMDSDGLEQCNPAYNNNNHVWSTSGFLYDLYHPNTSNRHKVNFTSYDVDGFTVTRNNDGNPNGGDVYYVWLALK